MLGSRLKITIRITRSVLKVRSVQHFHATMGVEASAASLLGQDFPIANSNCRIVVVGKKSGDDSLTELANLPSEARIVATGTTLEEIRKDGDMYTDANVLFNVTGNKETLPPILNEMPFLTWVHSITAGVDHIMCPEIKDNPDIILTNAKHVFSSSLAEYVMTSCAYFAKNIPRLLKQKEDREWNQFRVTELRGRTMGIVGYGSIGSACARLAKAYGMKVMALRRNPDNSRNDPYVDQTYGPSDINTIIARSDYLVVCMPLTAETHKMIGAANLQHAQRHLVLINIGRGPLLDEDALIEALKNGTILGAALDVFTVEPLPEASELWSLPNVLISPHNADILVDSRHSSVRFFTENCKNFLSGQPLDCVVDKSSGY